MLILARKVGQRIVISDDIEIMVVEIRGEQVRLGITAPRSVAVHRKELLDQVAAENIEAANTAQSEASGGNHLLSPPDKPEPLTLDP